MKTKQAFTLIELLVVISLIGILSALLLPALSSAKAKGRRIACEANLKQVNVAIRLYADDWADSLPVLPSPNPYPNGVGAYYKQMVKAYLGLAGPASPDERVFICPSDPVVHTRIGHAFTSYTFNGYEVVPDAIPRITGQHLSAVRNPCKAVLVAEWPAFAGAAWHPAAKPDHPDLKNVLSFVDGHVNFVEIFWDGVPGSGPARYEPPPNYDYNWDGQ
jgi:prepilin-type N-terminal cleavage/methylation domain-containing protein